MEDPDANSDNPFGLSIDRRRIAFGAALAAYFAWFGLVITPGAPLPTEANFTGLRIGAIALAAWGGLEYLRSRRER